MLTKFFRRSKPTRKPQPRLNLVSLEARDVPANFLVINNNDSGIGSLRQAVSNANSSAGHDDIVFSSFFDTARTVTLTSGQIAVTEELNIFGPSIDRLTISGNNSSRIFNFTPAAINSLGLWDLTLTSGKVVGTQSGPAIQAVGGYVYLREVAVENCKSENHGAIRVTGGAFTSYDSQFRDNSAKFGGAVSLDDNVGATFGGSVFERNSATHSGGAVYAQETSVILSLSSFTDNKAGLNGGAYFVDYDGDFQFLESTFLRNSAIFGGAIAIENANTPFTHRYINDCTFTDNLATSRGGAIRLLDLTNGVGAQITNCTIVGNTAQGFGGGISFENNQNGSILVASSIVAGNTSGTPGSNADFDSNFPIRIQANAIGSTAGFVSTNLGGNILGQTPASLKLGPLADNGGPTATIALGAGSPAINAGIDYTNYGYDQRGEPRATNGAVDIGAFETQQNFIVTNTKDSGAGSLRQAVLDANAFVSSGDVITFDPAVFNVSRTITLTSGGIASTDEVEIDGPGANLLTINGNNAAQPITFGNDEDGTFSTLRGVRVTNVNHNNNFAVVSNEHSLVVEDCIITGNKATGVGAQSSPSLTITGSVISNNSSSYTSGGGVYFDNNQGFFTLRDSTISNNTANQGGGLQLFGTIEILNSTISGNRAKYDQGAAGVGGGISILNLGAPAKIWNSTITNNTGDSFGGGIYVYSANASSLNITSSVVAGNQSQIGPDIQTFDIFVPVDSRASAIGNLSGIAKYNDLGGNIAPGTDLKLNPLDNTGGLGSTHTPKPGSPLLNNGSNPKNLATDQRGQARSFQGGVDIGSVEARIAPQIEVTVGSGKDQRSRVRSLTVSFDRIVSLAAGAFDLVRLGPGNPSGPVTLNVDTSFSTPTQTLATLTWSPSAFTEFGSLIDGDYRLAIVASQVTDSDGLTLDGNGDGLGGDTATVQFHRLFGDSNGDRTVDGSTDFAAFGNCFGTSLGEATFNDAFDFNDDGTIDGSTDFAQFGARFGTTL